MIFSNILLSILILFFGIRLFLAIRQTRTEKPKLRLISKETGEVVELNMNEMVDLIATQAQPDFKNTAKTIFSRVSNAFAEGSLGEVKQYLGDGVSTIFEQAIDERRKSGQSVEFSLIGFKDVQVLENEQDKKVVSFTTEQVNLLKNEKGEVMEGDPLYVATVQEKWTFVKKKENMWIVTGIEQGEAHFA